MRQLSVVVPTYNEATHIHELLGALLENLRGRDVEIVVVDDNSPDGTHAKVSEYARIHPEVVPVLRTTEKGLATAVIEGLRRAQGTYVCVMDSDFQHPPSAVPRLLDAALERNADVVVASRYVGGGEVHGFPLARRVISWGAKTLAQVGLPSVRRFRIKDPMSGFFLVRRDGIPFERLRPRGYKILLELLAKMHLDVVAEVGYRFENRRGGESKLKTKTQVDYFLHVLGLAFHDRENRRMALFASVGTTGIAVHLAVLRTLAEFFGWRSRWFLSEYDIGILLAATIAREVAILWNFAWNDAVTFRDKRAHAHAGFFHRLFRFHVVSLWAFAGYLVVYYPLVLFGVHYLLSAVIAILASFLLNYGGNVRWTYAGRREARRD